MKKSNLEVVQNLSLAWQQKWPAPAKINRFLHIVGQRDDGYHLLQSVFQFVDICDYLTFTKSNHSSITIESPLSQITLQQNLVYRAAKLLHQTASVQTGLVIHLEKNIPMGAGLGGGSSDAATTLLVLNHLWNCKLTSSQLCELGLKLGADVPFFIKGQNAFVEGIGEKISAINIDCPWLLIAVPDCHISTAEVFSNKHLKRTTPPITIQQILDIELTEKGYIPLQHFGQNDCESLVLKQYPKVKQAHSWLQNFSSPRLTGTGCCLFSIFTDKKIAIVASENVHPKFPIFFSTTLSESPILELLKQFSG